MVFAYVKVVAQPLPKVHPVIAKARTKDAEWRLRNPDVNPLRLRPLGVQGDRNARYRQSRIDLVVSQSPGSAAQRPLCRLDVFIVQDRRIESRTMPMPDLMPDGLAADWLWSTEADLFDIF
jgi:hypothetical protein